MSDLAYHDFRSFVEEAKKISDYRVIEEADWDAEIGALPREWNWLTTEYPDNYEAKLLHYTLGTPCFEAYWSADMADEWHAHHARAEAGMHV